MELRRETDESLNESKSSGVSLSGKWGPFSESLWLPCILIGP
jgi:hypothetical protein